MAHHSEGAPNPTLPYTTEQPYVQVGEGGYRVVNSVEGGQMPAPRVEQPATVSEAEPFEAGRRSAVEAAERDKRQATILYNQSILQHNVSKAIDEQGNVATHHEALGDVTYPIANVSAYRDARGYIKSVGEKQAVAAEQAGHERVVLRVAIGIRGVGTGGEALGRNFTNEALNSGFGAPNIITAVGTLDTNVQPGKQPEYVFESVPTDRTDATLPDRDPMVSAAVMHNDGQNAAYMRKLDEYTAKHYPQHPQQ